MLHTLVSLIVFAATTSTSQIAQEPTARRDITVVSYQATVVERGRVMESKVIADSLWDAKDPFGNPRFYPRGQHPAAARYRLTLEKLEALDSDDKHVVQCIAFLKARIEDFEAGEDERKLRYLLRKRRCAMIPNGESHAQG